METYNRKKREEEEEERQRLFKLVEQQYRYKGEIYDSAYGQDNINEQLGIEPRSDEIRLEITEEGEVRERSTTFNGMYRITVHTWFVILLSSNENPKLSHQLSDVLLIFSSMLASYIVPFC